MPTATLAELMDELADRIRTQLDAAVIAAADDVEINLQVEGRMVLAPTPPTIDIYPADPSADPELAAFGDKIGGEILTVRARVDTADTDAGQNLLLAFMDDDDPLSLATAIYSDTKLNGLAATLDVRSRSGYVLVPRLDAEGAHLGCLFGVVVVKARS